MITPTRTPQWHPAAKIPFFTELVDSMLESAEKQLYYLEKAKGKAHVLDEVTIQRVLKAQHEQNTHVALFKEQCQRWRREPLSNEQCQAVSQLEAKIVALENTGRQIGFLADHYQHHTINKILAMDPEELAIAVLAQQIDLPK